jgi:hypothetical protein
LRLDAALLLVLVLELKAALPLEDWLGVPAFFEPDDVLAAPDDEPVLVPLEEPAGAETVASAA